MADVRYNISKSAINAAMAGAAFKYSSLMAGVYSIAQEEKHWGITILSGLVYLLGEILVRGSAETSQTLRFRELEDNIKGSH